MDGKLAVKEIFGELTWDEQERILSFLRSKWFSEQDFEVFIKRFLRGDVTDITLATLFYLTYYRGLRAVSQTDIMNTFSPYFPVNYLYFAKHVTPRMINEGYVQRVTRSGADPRLVFLSLTDLGRLYILGGDGK